MIRFYPPTVSDDEALDMLVPRQKDRAGAETIDLDAAPDPAEITAPG